jgi:hypothetical protein
MINWSAMVSKKSLKCSDVGNIVSDFMAICTFCGKPAEKEVGKKGVCKVCAGEIVKMFEDELKGKPSK